ncbi:hypothetical protein EAI89_13560 [Eubacterium sp. am_0171]|uniref:Helix-turn-helix protein n=1 Tax=Faecalicatena contorta TaxID=39482 RepID=A0A173ZNM2_9FIRM|nr:MULTISPECIES: GntR family transcriptional regulator YhfZ [Clostridia]MSC84893.1 hypothetical protein [Eubacterium sp. BIOML-A1]MSD07181.1 hypothetical protein [Eubacterium sp. BIOML-A2]RYT16092.1 hypothetical protein EAI89_13560 [Eubacterium sp. am_0171]CUN77821.1 Uncharacterised protein [[Eubacterium] contortum] [Faecalicatena contorta]
MDVDGRSVLYQKIGVTISNMALSLLSKNVGDRIHSISQYQEEFGVSRGTIQNAISYLKEVRAVVLAPHGHLGTYVEWIDYVKLQECCVAQGLMGIMPLPYSVTYEGFATAMYEQLKNLRFNMAYARGAVGRMELVESGVYQFAICSQYAVEHEMKIGKNIEIALNFGAGSFLSRHVLLLRDQNQNGIADGMKVAYDSDSLDQSQITKNVVKGKRVELVNIPTQQTVTALLEGTIDAGVWNYDDILENHHLYNLKVVFLNASEYSDSFSTAVLVIRKDSGYLKKVLEKNISVSMTLKIQNEVRSGKRHPFY